MSKHDADQKGPQQHAEGQQGKKTHDAFIDGLHGRHGGSPDPILPLSPPGFLRYLSYCMATGPVAPAKPADHGIDEAC